jgi:hypothetical protein
MSSENTKTTEAINERMVQISEFIDQDSEAARIQGGVLTGGLVGGWSVAGAITAGYSPAIAAVMLTVGVVGGIAARIMI